MYFLSFFNISLIFRKEIYATACIAGATTYVLLESSGVDKTLNLLISGAIIISIRVVAVVKKLSLPLINDRI